MTGRESLAGDNPMAVPPQPVSEGCKRRVSDLCHQARPQCSHNRFARSTVHEHRNQSNGSGRERTDDGSATRVGNPARPWEGDAQARRTEDDHRRERPEKHGREDRRQERDRDGQMAAQRDRTALGIRGKNARPKTAPTFPPRPSPSRIKPTARPTAATTTATRYARTGGLSPASSRRILRNTCVSPKWVISSSCRQSKPIRGILNEQVREVREERQDRRRLRFLVSQASRS